MFTCIVKVNGFRNSQRGMKGGGCAFIVKVIRGKIMGGDEKVKCVTAVYADTMGHHVVFPGWPSTCTTNW